MRRALLLIFLGVPLAGGAQVPTIIPGARVRVETRQTDKRLEGTLMSQTADSLTIASVGAIRTVVPSGSITTIRVSQGKSHGAGAIRGSRSEAVSDSAWESCSGWRSLQILALTTTPELSSGL